MLSYFNICNLCNANIAGILINVRKHAQTWFWWFCTNVVSQLADQLKIRTNRITSELAEVNKNLYWSAWNDANLLGIALSNTAGTCIVGNQLALLAAIYWAFLDEEILTYLMQIWYLTAEYILECFDRVSILNHYLLSLFSVFALWTFISGD